MNSFTFEERETSLFYRILFFSHVIQHMLMQPKLVLLFIFHNILGQGFLFFPRALAELLLLDCFRACLWLQSGWALRVPRQRAACSAVVTRTGSGFVPSWRLERCRWRHADSSMNNQTKLLDSLKNRLLCSLLLTPSFLKNTEMWGKNNVIICAETMGWDITIGKGIKFNWTLQSKPGAHLSIF